MRKEEKLAELQRQYMDTDTQKEGRELIHQTWFKEDTVDYWRHKRMYETIRAFAELKQHADWLTVGDGRFALDAVRLKKLFGIESIFPTDIAGNMLQVSKENGYINDYGVENAEKLSFADESYDVIFCKEAFHHFPRPYLALYEMIRVAKEAVIMVEPAEGFSRKGLSTITFVTSALKMLLSKITRKHYLPKVAAENALTHKFEDAGNYLYAVSLKELEKLIHGMDLGGLAFKQFNDVYMKGCEFERASPGNQLFEALSGAINNLDSLCREHSDYYRPNMLSVIIFKKEVPEAVRVALELSGFSFVVKVKNPYL